jgi:dihydrofolate synthase/folylpolyglutamate synthase
MTYQETIDFLYSRLPVFHLIGARAFKPGLHTTQALCLALGNPENKFRSIHVGGTNGKGSTSHMLASILAKAGYRVGLYTSPHLKSFTERIRIGGTPISEQFIVDFVSDNLFNIDRLEPSFFELTVAMAFSYFAEKKVDIAVIEVGMGGRLDSTNVITPLLSVITNVSYDHTQFLGDTLDKIAFEKAGIIKEKVPIVVSERQGAPISNVFLETASGQSSVLTFGSDRFVVERTDQEDYSTLRVNVTDKESGEVIFNDLKSDLAGSYQIRNIAGVLASIEQLKKLGFNIERNHIIDGLREVAVTTGLNGRWQKLSENPLIYADTAHNFAGLSETLGQFAATPSTQRRFVIGFVGDKDITTMLGLFPKDGVYYFCQPSNQRALKVSDLLEMAQKAGLAGKIFQNVNAALECAIIESEITDTIYVGGSTFVVADLDQL